MLRKKLLDGSSRGRIVTLLRRGPLTADDMSAELRLTAAAIRAHLTAMERDGIVRRAGRRTGTTRPPQLFALTAEIEQLLSGAYLPVLIELVRQTAAQLNPKEFRELMRNTGRGLAEMFLPTRLDAPLLARINAVALVVNEQFGSTMKIEKKNGHYTMRGFDCPLAALTGNHPAVCLAVETLVATLLGASVKECCDRTQRPRCCFHIGNSRVA